MAYHSPVRRWFILLLIALLPLRGWVGEAMAGEMLAQRTAAAAAHAAQPHDGDAGQHEAHGSGHDCMDGHAAAPADGTDAQHGDCPTCAACQVCSSVALGIDMPSTITATFAHVPPAWRDIHFASAEPVRAVEPPIS